MGLEPRREIMYTLSTRNRWAPLTPLIYSQNHVTIISTNDKALPHPNKKPTTTHNSFIRSDEALTLETSAFQIFHGGNSTFINSFDETKFSCITLSPTRHRSFFKNYKFVSALVLRETRRNWEHLSSAFHGNWKIPILLTKNGAHVKVNAKEALRYEAFLRCLSSLLRRSETVFMNEVSQAYSFRT